MTPLTPPAKKLPCGQQDQGRKVVLHVQEEVYQSTLTFRRSVAKNFDFLVLHIPVLSHIEPNQGQNTSP